MLKSLGAKTLFASTGEEALSEIQKGHVDCVIMDCEPPNLKGIMTSKKIRDAKIKVPIIALNGATTDEHLMTCMQAGMNDFLDKPFKINELHDVMSRWLKNAP